MIAGIVLAAGRSRRMGRPKALLTLGGRSFVERAIDALQEGGCERVWIVVFSTSDPTVARLAQERGAAVVVNPDGESEQIESLAAGLRLLPADAEAAVVLPVDVPSVDPGTVRALLDAFRDAAAPIVIPSVDGRHGHPVLFARRVWPELLAPDLPEGARSVIHAHAHELLEVTVSALPADVDTPEDYVRLVEET